MTWTESIIGLLGGVTRSELQERVKEAVGNLPVLSGRDPEDWKFRRLSQLETRDLNPVAQDRMLDIAAYLYVVNPLAGSLVEVTRDFVIGKGFQATSQNPEVDRVIKRFWGDGVNSMDLKLPEKVLQLGLFGEQCYPAYVSANYGLVRLGYVDPARIEDVIHDPDNVEMLIAVITRDATGRAGKRYRIILNEDEGQIVSPAGQRIREQCADGDCFFFTVNRLSNMSRGKSDLMRLLDWLDAYEEFLFEDLERTAKHLNTFVWDITFKGLTEEEIGKKMAEMRPPRRGSVRAHNENVTWQAVAPDIKASDVHQAGQTYKRHIVGTGARLPLTWFGDPEDSNRASSQEMSDPPVVKLSARQLYIINCVKEILRYQLAQARAAGTLSVDAVQLLGVDGKPKGEPVPLRDAFSVAAPEISVKDSQKLAGCMVSLSSSLAIAEQQGWLSKEKAAEIFAVVASQLGPEVDVAMEVQDTRVTADYMDAGKIRRLRQVASSRQQAAGGNV
jgi:hypothetical protein